MASGEPIRKRAGGPGGAGGAGGSRVTPQEIPDKLYFRIGEVAKLCEVPAYVLRFWESEFPQLKPNKGGTGQRLYRRRDVEMALRVKTLLYDEGYTIAGARQAFKAELRAGKEAQPGDGDEGGRGVDPKHLQALQKELRELYTLLSRPAAKPATVQAIRAPRPVPPPRVLPAPMLFPKPGQPRKPAPLASLFDDFPSDE